MHANDLLRVRQRSFRNHFFHLLKSRECLRHSASFMWACRLSVSFTVDIDTTRIHPRRVRIRIVWTLTTITRNGFENCKYVRKSPFRLPEILMKFILIFQHIGNISCGKCIWMSSDRYAYSLRASLNTYWHAEYSHFICMNSSAHRASQLATAVSTCVTDWLTDACNSNFASQPMCADFYFHIFSTWSNIMNHRAFICGHFVARDDGFRNRCGWIDCSASTSSVGIDAPSATFISMRASENGREKMKRGRRRRKEKIQNLLFIRACSAGGAYRMQRHRRKCFARKNEDYLSLWAHNVHCGTNIRVYFSGIIFV